MGGLRGRWRSGVGAGREQTDDYIALSKSKQAMAKDHPGRPEPCDRCELTDTGVNILRGGWHMWSMNTIPHTRDPGACAEYINKCNLSSN